MYRRAVPELSSLWKQIPPRFLVSLMSVIRVPPSFVPAQKNLDFPLCREGRGIAFWRHGSLPLTTLFSESQVGATIEEPHFTCCFLTVQEFH